MIYLTHLPDEDSKEQSGVTSYLMQIILLNHDLIKDYIQKNSRIPN